MLSPVISRLGNISPATLTANMVAFVNMVFLLPNRLPRFEDVVNSDGYLTGAIANIQHLQCWGIAESFLHNCHCMLFFSLSLKLIIFLQYLEQGYATINYSEKHI